MRVPFKLLLEKQTMQGLSFDLPHMQRWLYLCELCLCPLPHPQRPHSAVRLPAGVLPQQHLPSLPLLLPQLPQRHHLHSLQGRPLPYFQLSHFDMRLPVGVRPQHHFEYLHGLPLQLLSLRNWSEQPVLILLGFEQEDDKRDELSLQ